jgi:ethanolaminephosphotransferase
MPAGTSVLYDHVLSPFYDRLALLIWPTWIHPNVITCLGGLSAACSLVGMGNEQWTLAFVAFTMYHMCDNMDGKHARRTNQSSMLGHVLDHALDGSVGVMASCRICCDHLFGFPSAVQFALCCGMTTLLTCHIAERCTGVATLGTRIFGADELFLTCSFALGYRACTGSPVLRLGPETDVWWPVVRNGWIAAIGILALTAVTPRQPLWLAFLAAFGLLCVHAPWPWPQAVVYALALAALLISNARRAAQAQQRAPTHKQRIA